MKILNYIKLVVLLILFASLTHGFYYIENDIDTLAGILGMLFILIVFRIISNGIKRRKKHNILKQNRQVKAKINQVKVLNKNIYVLQLNFNHNNTEYITGYVYIKPKSVQTNEYQKGNSIYIYINSNNPYEIEIPQLQNQDLQSPNNKTWIIIWAVVILLSIGLPLLINVFDESARKFEEIAYIETDSSAHIWELRYEPEEKIYIKIYDPITGKKIKTLTSDIENDPNYNFIFSMYRQNNNMFILSTGIQPFMEVYNGISHEKISGLEEFVQSNKKMKSGIATLNKKSYNSEFVDDVILEIVTNNGKELFYNITKDTFYNSDKEFKKYIDKTDLEIMSDKLISFALAPVEGNNYQKLLYIINSTSKKDKDDLLELAAYTNFDIGVFQRSKRYKCKKCTENLVQEEPFLESTFLFVDTSISVISSIESLAKDAEELITCYDKTSKKLFQIKESDYPNYEEMKEKDFHARDISSIKCSRYNNKLIIFFEAFGALGFDLSTGKQLWKFAP